ncbi:MAG: type II toxin-antitoxin system HicA family toxin [Pseudomonadales bacterium]|nr:type II toxin-antitoxin system HicA family toxin [Pseudomonadales bacterium]
MTSKEIIKMIVKNGWGMVRQKGSHIHFKHTSSKNLVTIPHPVIDIPIGTMNSILRKAGIRT